MTFALLVGVGVVALILPSVLVWALANYNVRYYTPEDAKDDERWNVLALAVATGPLGAIFLFRALTPMAKEENEPIRIGFSFK